MFFVVGLMVVVCSVSYALLSARLSTFSLKHFYLYLSRWTEVWINQLRGVTDRATVTMRELFGRVTEVWDCLKFGLTSQSDSSLVLHSQVYLLMVF